MATRDPSNISLGAGTLYAAPVSATEPVAASAVLSSPFRDLGWTEEGSTFSYEFSSEDIMVAEELDPVLVETTGRVATVSFQLAEMTRENLGLSLNMGADVAAGTAAIEPPDPGTEQRVMLIHKSAKGSLWIFRRCLQTGTVEVANKKAPDKKLLQVEFKLEKPANGLRLFKVYPNANGVV